MIKFILAYLFTLIILVSCWPEPVVQDISNLCNQGDALLLQPAPETLADVTMVTWRGNVEVYKANCTLDIGGSVVVTAVEMSIGKGAPCQDFSDCLQVDLLCPHAQVQPIISTGGGQGRV